MKASTRGRNIAAGFLAASTLLGTALAAGPAMEHDGHAAMEHDGHAAVQQEVAPRMQQDVAPGMQQEVTPRTQQEVTLAALRKVRPGPWEI